MGGGKLTDIRRQQQRLAGQVEELQMAMNQLVDTSRLAEIDGYEFNMESFKRESSALPEMPKFCQTLGTSYNLFNNAPYSPTTSRPGSAMSSRPCSTEPPMSRISESQKNRTIKVSVAVDSTDDEDLPADAYLPQKSRGLKSKKVLGTGRRPATSTDVSDTESEESCYQYEINERMTPLEAKQKAEEERLKTVEDQARLQEAVKEQLKREEKEQEELAAKKKGEDEKKKAIMEAKQKAAAEKAAELEAKRKAEEDKKKAELDAKRKEETAKKKEVA